MQYMLSKNIDIDLVYVISYWDYDTYDISSQPLYNPRAQLLEVSCIFLYLERKFQLAAMLNTDHKPKVEL